MSTKPSRVLRWTSLPLLLALLAPAAAAQVATPRRKADRTGAAGAAAGASVGMAPMPLASHPQGQQMMAQAAERLALLDINFRFLNKTYENDQYVREPVTGKKIRTACIRFRSTSGFRFRMDVPQFTLTGQGLTVVQNFSKITADGLTVKVQLGPCADVAAGIGLRLSDVRVTYRARPMLSFEDDSCTLNWNLDTDDLRISIGDLNITGVQNDMDKLAKDAVREALNAALQSVFGGALRGELARVAAKVCGHKNAQR